MSDFTVRYTNRDIVEKIDNLKESVDVLSEHVKATNGRVTALEKAKVVTMSTCVTLFVAITGWLIYSS